MPPLRRLLLALTLSTSLGACSGEVGGGEVATAGPLHQGLYEQATRIGRPALLLPPTENPDWWNQRVVLPRSAGARDSTAFSGAERSLQEAVRRIDEEDANSSRVLLSFVGGELVEVVIEEIVERVVKRIDWRAITYSWQLYSIYSLVRLVLGELPELVETQEEHVLARRASEEAFYSDPALSSLCSNWAEELSVHRPTGVLRGRFQAETPFYSSELSFRERVVLEIREAIPALRRTAESWLPSFAGWFQEEADALLSSQWLQDPRSKIYDTYTVRFDGSKSAEEVVLLARWNYLEGGPSWSVHTLSSWAPGEGLELRFRSPHTLLDVELQAWGREQSFSGAVQGAGAASVGYRRREQEALGALEHCRIEEAGRWQAQLARIDSEAARGLGERISALRSGNELANAAMAGLQDNCRIEGAAKLSAAQELLDSAVRLDDCHEKELRRAIGYASRVQRGRERLFEVATLLKARSGEIDSLSRLQHRSQVLRHTHADLANPCAEDDSQLESGYAAALRRLEVLFRESNGPNHKHVIDLILWARDDDDRKLQDVSQRLLDAWTGEEKGRLRRADSMEELASEFAAVALVLEPRGASVFEASRVELLEICRELSRENMPSTTSPLEALNALLDYDEDLRGIPRGVLLDALAANGEPWLAGLADHLRSEDDLKQMLRPLLTLCTGDTGRSFQLFLPPLRAAVDDLLVDFESGIAKEQSYRQLQLVAKAAGAFQRDFCHGTAIDVASSGLLRAWAIELEGALTRQLFSRARRDVEPGYQALARGAIAAAKSLGRELRDEDKAHGPLYMEAKVLLGRAYELDGGSKNLVTAVQAYENLLGPKSETLPVSYAELLSRARLGAAIAGCRLRQHELSDIDLALKNRDRRLGVRAVGNCEDAVNTADHHITLAREFANREAGRLREAEAEQERLRRALEQRAGRLKKVLGIELEFR